MSLGLIWCDRELRTLQKFRNSKTVENTKTYKHLAILAVFLTFIAEFFCNYGMFTLDYFSNVVETSLWTIALALVFPYACNLVRRAKEIQDSELNKSVNVSYIFYFAVMSAIVSFSFVAFLVYDHIPL